MHTYLDFEKPVAALDGKIAELRALSDDDSSDAIKEEIKRLEAKSRDTLESIYDKVTPWQRTQIARHPQRPHMKAYLERLIKEFTPLAGDRGFAEDHALVGGLGRFRGEPVVVIGQEKGSDTESRLHHNFGMARPEGYRRLSG